MTTPTCGPTPLGCRQTAACDLDVACRNPPCEAGYHHPSAVSTLCVQNPPPQHVPVLNHQHPEWLVAVVFAILIITILVSKGDRR